jgi:hypothetical protein
MRGSTPDIFPLFALFLRLRSFLIPGHGPVVFFQGAGKMVGTVILGNEIKVIDICRI